MSESIKRGLVDRRHWPAGEWDGEPDRVDFETAAGYPGRILRDSLLGHLCGYVAVPKGHPAHGRKFGAGLPLSVHGGITYSRADGDLWWLGFDAAHWPDVCPGYPLALLELLARADGVYRSVVYIRGECERLARQLAALGAPN